MRFLPNKRIALVVIMALTLSACGSGDDKKEVKSDSQVVAKVNGSEISIHQVNYQLGKLGQLDEAQGKEAAKQVLTRLVDQQVLKEKAIEAKLDRNPDVVQAIEALKDQLLAQAYLEQKIKAAPKPSDAEIKDFYQKNPLLFENRHIYRLQELVVNVDTNQMPSVRQKVAAMKQINDIAEWLKSNNYVFSANTNVRTAEQLPMDVLNKIANIKAGEVVSVDTPNTINILHLVASKPEPIDLDKAKPLIARYLLTQSKNQAVVAELNDLKKAAKIQYLGQFSDLMKAGDVASTKNVVAAPKLDSGAKPKASSAGMDKGLSGL